MKKERDIALIRESAELIRERLSSGVSEEDIPLRTALWNLEAVLWEADSSDRSGTEEDSCQGDLGRWLVFSRDGWVSVLSKLEAEYLKTRDPVLLLEIVRGCGHYGVPLPPSALEWLGRGIDRYLSGNGDPLESCLGLASSGPGDRGPLYRSIKAKRDSFYIEWMVCLVEGFGFSPRQASEILIKYLSEMTFRIASPGPGVLATGRAIRELYGEWKEGDPADIEKVCKQATGEKNKAWARQSILEIIGVDVADPSVKRKRGRGG